MAIKLIYAVIVIPISTVLSKFQGTWDEWYALNRNDKFGPSWDDGHLFARASMDPRSIVNIIRKWERMGFTGEAIINREKKWIDFCEPETSSHCDWLSYWEGAGGVPAVFLSNTIPGEITSPK